MPYRYDVAGPYKTRERAETVLDDMYSLGEICDGEHPEIEKRGGKTASWSKAHYRYFITCLDVSM